MFCLSFSMDYHHRVLASRGVLLAIFACVGFVALLNRERTWKLVRNFFTAAGSPRNLAIFRIVLFTAIFFDLGNDMNPDILRFFSDLPSKLQSPPPGWSHLMRFVPLSPELASYALLGIKVFSVLAVIGFFTRTSGWIVTLLCIYAMGIPQYFGKTNHVHHTIWFAAILASSPCADVWSIDALIRRLRHRKPDVSDDGTTLATGSTLQYRSPSIKRAKSLVSEPAPSPKYALPLRFIWILIGMIYFFPGFWKVWHCGIDWAFSDNFRNQMYLKWYQLGGYSPYVRIDGYPWLTQPMALGAMVFELGFIFCLFFPRLRWAAVAIGLSFHLGTFFLMGIKFWSLVVGYLTFVNWDAILSRMRGTSTMVQPAEPRRWFATSEWPRGAIATFAVLFVGNFICGARELRDAWPFTCYPPFSAIAKDYDQIVDVVAVDDAGKTIPWTAEGVKKEFSPSRFAALMERLLKEKSSDKFLAYWSVLAKGDPQGLGRAKHVIFYNVAVDIRPAEMGKERSREQVWEVDPQ